MEWATFRIFKFSFGSQFTLPNMYSILFNDNIHFSPSVNGVAFHCSATRSIIVWLCMESKWKKCPGPPKQIVFMPTRFVFVKNSTLRILLPGVNYAQVM